MSGFLLQATITIGEITCLPPDPIALKLQLFFVLESGGSTTARNLATEFQIQAEPPTINADGNYVLAIQDLPIVGFEGYGAVISGTYIVSRIEITTDSTKTVLLLGRDFGTESYPNITVSTVNGDPSPKMRCPIGYMEITQSVGPDGALLT